MLKALLFAIAVTSVYAAVEQAVVILKTDTIDGRITFTKIDDGIKIEGNITGAAEGKHGFHIHEKGDLGNKCVAAGGHFNPTKQNHGAPDAAVRHVGDLGNVVANADKLIAISFTDKIIALDGDNNILGRALVLHEGEDDLGLGGESDSLTTGHAGARLACGVVGIVTETSGTVFSSSGSYLLILFALYTTLSDLFH